jgi:putative intracellular protease/amidase
MSPSIHLLPVRWAFSSALKCVRGQAHGILLLQEKYDALVIPGGMGGAVTMAGSTEVQNLVRSYYNHPEKRIIGMICAGMI